MRRIITTLAALGTSLVLLAACGAGDNGGASDPDAPLRIGASSTPHAEILEYIRDNLAEKQGLQLDIQVIDDYNIPNQAVSSGDLDANYFQHVPFLDQQKADHGYDLVVAATVHIEPLGIYSEKIKNLSDVPDGGRVAIANDPSNGGRGLALLAANNLIKLKAGVQPTAATKADIVENPKNLDITEIDAEQLVPTLPDTIISVINGNYALSGGLNPAKDALALETAKDNPYANVLVTTPALEKDKRITALAKLLTSPEVKKFIDEKYSGQVIAAF